MSESSQVFGFQLAPCLLHYDIQIYTSVLCSWFNTLHPKAKYINMCNPLLVACYIYCTTASSEFIRSVWNMTILWTILC